MTKPHWEKLHDAAISDVRFWLEEIWYFKKMLRKHPIDSMGDEFRLCIKRLKKALAAEVRGYEKIYGDKPNVRRIREEVEGV